MVAVAWGVVVVEAWSDEWDREWTENGFCVACYLRRGGSRVELINPACDGCLCDDSMRRDQAGECDEKQVEASASVGGSVVAA